jgi:hypothetical protein
MSGGGRARLYPESSLQVWSQLLESLRRSGFREAGPEYLKLSQLVAEVRRRQLLRGFSQSEEAVWKKLSDVGVEAHALLGPLAEAARILAELPLRVSMNVAPIPPAACAPDPRTSSQPMAMASPVIAKPSEHQASGAADAHKASLPNKPAKGRKPSTKAKALRKHTLPHPNR